jgi:hypothetical protein
VHPAGDDGGRYVHGKAVQVDPIKPTLKAPGTKRLKLDYDEPLSEFAFKFNLRRYNTVVHVHPSLGLAAGGVPLTVGRCKLTLSNPS